MSEIESPTPADGGALPASTPWIVELRRRLESPEPRRLPPSDARRAAVLVPLYVDAGQMWTLLTRRAEHLPTHKGQIAFPGGSLEPGESGWQAALRETHEEIGVDPQLALPLGALDEAETPSGFRIVPHVAALPHPLQTAVNHEEIDEIFPVPIQALADPRLVEDRAVKIDGVERTLRIYHVGRAQIWGLTALIVHNLLLRLGFEASGEDAAG